MRVGRVVVEAPVASFRYPHFLIGRQASFNMPPPSTIYGLLCSAAGEWLDIADLKFAYRFQFRARGNDLEHQHIIAPGKGKFEVDGLKYQTNVRGTIQPYWRDFLFDCRLTLYLDPPELAEYLRKPVFAISLGRSQDLARIVNVEMTELKLERAAYFENTLLPFSMRTQTGLGYTVLMPRYISPPPLREPEFERYIVLHDRLYAGEVDSGLPCLMRYQDQLPEWLVDPDTKPVHGVNQGVIFHSFVGKIKDSIGN